MGQESWVTLDESVLSAWGFESLQAVIAMDSQSDEESEMMPSTEGQRDLSQYLWDYFVKLGWHVEVDAFANLVVHVPAHALCKQAPTVALMAHLDTSRGTQAVDRLCEMPQWDGIQPIAYPDNPRLCVNVENYPETQVFVGQDLLHGPGVAPIGLDNKLGMCEIMGLARVLATRPEIEHGALYFVFRPDEEIGRMAVLNNLADLLREKEVQYGYTIDGLDAFEVNVENFNAARGRVQICGEAIDLPKFSVQRHLILSVFGVKSHGATAKAEGYRNATRLYAQAMKELADDAMVIPLDFNSDPTSEVNATVSFLLLGEHEAALDALEHRVIHAFENQVAAHRLRGAMVEVVAKSSGAGITQPTDECRRLAVHLQQFLRTPGVFPLLSEDSQGHEGYSNPYFVQRKDTRTLILDYRLRAFPPEELETRKNHVRQVCEQGVSGVSLLSVDDQYINMGPALVPFPELVDWAEEAAHAMGVEILRYPIRGGTGVDPFLERGIPIANMGTGYFAPESEKEFTSRQMIGKHIQWLLLLVQKIGSVRKQS